MRATARLLIAATLAILALASGPSASAGQQTLLFNFRFDRTTWFWTQQRDVPVEAPVAVPGAPVPSQRVRVRSPQAANSLPVAVEDGKYEKISAILFDLAERGVEPGATIRKFVLSLLEDDAGDRIASFNSRGRVIQACRIDDFWPAGEAEEWATQPPFGGKPAPSVSPFEEGACVEGKRVENPARWVFDLTGVAEPWGADPLENYGVMLVGVLGDGGPTETWQINLKFPLRDNPDTDSNEYEDTKNYATVQLSFTPGAALMAPPPLGPAPAPPPEEAEVAGFEVPPPPSSVAPEPPPTGPVSTPAGQPVAAPALPPIEMPGAVWALVPLGLLALAAARSVVLEPVAGAKAGGVIFSIRQRNAERRGVPLSEEEADPLAAAKRFLGTAKNWLSILMRRGGT